MKLLDNPYQRIESLCLKNSKNGLDDLYKEADVFSNGSKQIQTAIETLKEKSRSISLLSVMLHCAQTHSKDPILGPRYCNLLGDLIEEKLFPFDMTLYDFSLLDQMVNISRIRMHDKWFLQKREDYVTFYVGFINLMSQMTYGVVPNAKDTDRLYSARRKLPFETYIDLLTLLPLRERILTRIFYLGGERALDEVLDLEIKHIDFQNQIIHFPEYFVAYSAPLFADLLRYLNGRKKGYVFISRQGEKISHTVPYRSLKVAVQKIGLPPTFTFKDLVKEY